MQPLNKPLIDISIYRIFNQQLPKAMYLLTSGVDDSGKQVDVPRTPITIQQLLKIRSNEMGRSEIAESLRNNPVTTGDVAIGDPRGSGEVIVARYENPQVRDLVHNIVPSTKLETCVTAAEYDGIRKNAFVIPKGVVECLNNCRTSQVELRYIFWKFVAGQTLFEKYSQSLPRDSSLGLAFSGKEGLSFIKVSAISESSVAHRCYDEGNLIGVANPMPLDTLVAIAQGREFSTPDTRYRPVLK